MGTETNEVRLDKDIEILRLRRSRFLLSSVDRCGSRSKSLIFGIRCFGVCQWAA